MRERELQRLLRRWKFDLGLLDWKIRLAIVDPDKIAGLWGELEYDCRLRDATIRISKECPDQEAALVHELLHCWTRQIREARKETMVEEQAIEAICAATMRCHRKGQK